MTVNIEDPVEIGISANGFGSKVDSVFLLPFFDGARTTAADFRGGDLFLADRAFFHGRISFCRMVLRALR